MQFFTENCRVFVRAESFRNPRRQIHGLVATPFCGGWRQRFVPSCNGCSVQFFTENLQSFDRAEKFSPLSFAVHSCSEWGLQFSTSSHDCSVQFVIENCGFLVRAAEFTQPAASGPLSSAIPFFGEWRLWFSTSCRKRSVQISTGNLQVFCLNGQVMQLCLPCRRGSRSARRGRVRRGRRSR